MKRYISAILACAAALAAGAQTITFDTADFRGVGAYDTWQQSPLTTGKLRPNVAVMDNQFSDSINSSKRIVGFQRSRYGSNTYGAEIKLRSPWSIGTKPQYVHVLLR